MDVTLTAMSPRQAVAPSQSEPQNAEAIALSIEQFLLSVETPAVLEDGKILFRFSQPGSGHGSTAKWSVSTEHGRCTLQMWSGERNLVRRVLATESRGATLRLSTQRFGQREPRLLELCSVRERRLPTQREASRKQYLKLLERVLTREFAPFKPESMHSAMDLERSFGPAYARGSLVRGKEAWAVIGVGSQESTDIIDGVLTLGILWLHECRTRAGGRRLYTGLRLFVPEGAGTLTHSRLPWLNRQAAHWELSELNEGDERLTRLDPEDQGNLRTALVHRPDETSAQARFADAIRLVKEIVPAGEWERVEQRLRSPTEMAFCLHGLPFARAKIMLENRSFRHRLEVSAGAGPAERLLSSASRDFVSSHVADLFARRRAHPVTTDYGARGLYPREESYGRAERRIGSGVREVAHRRAVALQRHDANELPAAQDPLFRAAPERWLESVLCKNLAPLTRNLAPQATHTRNTPHASYSDDTHADSRGNRADLPQASLANRGGGSPSATAADSSSSSRLIPRLDPRHVYTQVPAIAGASDRGMLDLLGISEDGRLAVVELKADDDLHFALQGLDYWIRVRHHHSASVRPASGLGEFQRYGYFTDAVLSPEPPRLYLVAPALHIHPATETVLRYFSPRVEWHLLALDERWRQAIRVVWRKSNVRL